ncbi:MAG: hypothetical protein CFH42_01715 [Alphaproteobacteria bacterium MarineAlpha12_Bin1]|nr:MAG: hypothetical protein CFH42_01715 [Alphaproteobacteria bacterium MarineAlpha12_Bin1]
MKRISLEKKGGYPNFIGAWFLEPPSLCDEIVDFFENNQEKQKAGKLANGTQDDNVKKTTDITIYPYETKLETHNSINKYIESLYDCYVDYLATWPFLKVILPSVDIGAFNIQRYHEGEHYQEVHTERSSMNTLHRVLAWMTYLNDVEDGGSTSFHHYDLDVKPEKGKTLIWPADWTHAHSGKVLNSGTKYIITGWMHITDG